MRGARPAARIDLFTLACVLGNVVAAVSGDPILTDLYMDVRGVICFKCHGSRCKLLVYELGEALERLTGRVVIVKREGKRLCFEPLDARL